MEKSRKGFVYVIQNTTASATLYKIGRTKNIKQRLTNLQVGNAGIMRALYYLPVADTVKAERVLHAIFAADRVKGEWYRIRDMELLKRIFAANDNTEYAEQFIRMGLR